MKYHIASLGSRFVLAATAARATGDLGRASEAVEVAAGMLLHCKLLLLPRVG